MARRSRRLVIRATGTLLLSVAGVACIWHFAPPSEVLEATSASNTSAPSGRSSGARPLEGTASGRVLAAAASSSMPAGPTVPGAPDQIRARSASGDSVSILVTPQWGSITDGQPFRNPVDRWLVTSEMCPGQPTGIDIATDGQVTVRSAASGIVTFVGPLGNYGNLVMVQHASGYLTSYGHLSLLLVKEGQRIAAGDPLGVSGGDVADAGNGLSTGSHLHFEILKNGLPVQPIVRIPGPWQFASNACYAVDPPARR